MNNQLIFKNSCWNCKQAREDPQEKYFCPRWQNHWNETMSVIEKASFKL